MVFQMKVFMQEVSSSIPRPSVPAESSCSFGMFRCREQIFQGRGILQEISSHHNPELREVFREKSGLEPFVGLPEGEPNCETEHSKAIGHRHSKRSASKAIGAFTSPNQELVRHNYFPQRQNYSQRLLASSEYHVGVMYPYLGGMYPYLYMQMEPVRTLGNVFVCPVRKQMLTSQANLQQHEEMHTSRQSSPYNISYSNLTGNNELLTHNESRMDERSFSCTQCDKKFSTKYSLQRHQLTHTGERPFKCDICGSAFTGSDYLRIHRRTHTGERPYKCDFCAHASATKSDLERHRRTHTGERPYKCDFCAYASATKGDLEKHRRKHTGERPYKCKFCDYASANLSNLKTHARLRHESSIGNTSTDSPTS